MYAAEASIPVEQGGVCLVEGTNGCGPSDRGIASPVFRFWVVNGYGTIFHPTF